MQHKKWKQWICGAALCLLLGLPATMAGAEELSVSDAVQQNTQDAADAMTREADVVFHYAPGGLYRIYCQAGHLTDIRMQPGEEIQFIGGGDTVRWVVDKAAGGSGAERQWHVYLKPLQSGLETNIIVTTNRHSYQLQAVSTNWYNPIVGWNYPQEEKAAFLREQELLQKKENEVTTMSVSKPELLNFGYEISNRSYSWTPVLAFDDGKKTYIKMSEKMRNTEAPVLFVVDRNGKLNMVNYRFKSNYFIVDRLFDVAEMRNGKDEVVKIKRKDR